MKIDRFVAQAGGDADTSHKGDFMSTTLVLLVDVFVE